MGATSSSWSASEAGKDPIAGAVEWDRASKGGNATLLENGWVEITGAGTVLSSEGITEGSASWEFEVALTGRGSWIGVVPIGPQSGQNGQNGEGGAKGLGVDLDKSLGAIGWAIWGGETGAIHPMYIRGAQSDQTLGFRAGLRPGLTLTVTSGAAATAASGAAGDTGPGSGGGGTLDYSIDGEAVCCAFEELPVLEEGGAWRLAASNGWAGTTRVRARRV